MTGDRIQAQRTWKGKTGLTGGSLKCTSKMLGQKGLQGIRKDVLNRKKKKISTLQISFLYSRKFIRLKNDKKVSFVKNLDK